MALIYLSLGSNIERHLHIGAALDALAENFGELKISSVVRRGPRLLVDQVAVAGARVRELEARGRRADP